MSKGCATLCNIAQYRLMKEEPGLSSIKESDEKTRGWFSHLGDPVNYRGSFIFNHFKALSPRRLAQCSWSSVIKKVGIESKLGKILSSWSKYHLNTFDPHFSTLYWSMLRIFRVLGNSKPNTHHPCVGALKGILSNLIHFIQLVMSMIEVVTLS